MIRSRTLFVSMSALCVLVALCAFMARPIGHPPAGVASSSPDELDSAPANTFPTPTAAASPTASPATTVAVEPVHDLRGLLRPSRRYLGIAAVGAPADMGVVERFAERTGARPNMIAIYQAFGDPFVISEVRATYRYGALAILRWEPFDASLAEIALGRHDTYIRSYANAVRSLGLPIAITFAHEMNGRWYPWGSHRSTGRDFNRAWRRIHRIFEDSGATNVIWAWTPNVISGAPGVKLENWYPGDRYVDWIGIDGYVATDGAQTYAALFGPTMKEVQKFSKRPFLIVETGVERGGHREAALRSLMKGVAADSRMLGLVYFNQPGSRDWLLDTDPPAMATFGSLAKRLDYGFTVT